MVAMDTQFSGIHCAISDVIIILFFQLQLPQNFTDRNETFDILKSLWGSTKAYLRILNFRS